MISVGIWSNAAFFSWFSCLLAASVSSFEISYPLVCLISGSSSCLVQWNSDSSYCFKFPSFFLYCWLFIRFHVLIFHTFSFDTFLLLLWLFDVDWNHQIYFGNVLFLHIARFPLSLWVPVFSFVWCFITFHSSLSVTSVFFFPPLDPKFLPSSLISFCFNPLVDGFVWSSFHHCAEVLNFRFCVELKAFIHTVVQNSFDHFLCYWIIQLSYVLLLFFSRCFFFHSEFEGAKQR